MALIRPKMSPDDLVEGILAMLPPTEAEVEACEAFSKALKFEEGKDPANLLPEFLLLKVSVGCEYALGLLEQLGMKAEGIQQFYSLLTGRLARNFAAFFSGMPGHSVAMLKS